MRDGSWRLDFNHHRRIRDICPFFEKSIEFFKNNLGYRTSIVKRLKTVVWNQIFSLETKKKIFSKFIGFPILRDYFLPIFIFKNYFLRKKIILSSFK